MRLLTYNIHKCIGGVDRRYRPARVIDVLAHYNPDIALLQEVDQFAKRSSRDDQATMLAGALGLQHVAFFKNVDIRGGGGYGNAVVSRIFLRRCRNVDLTIRFKKRRSALHVVLRVWPDRGGRSKTVHLFNAHLGLAHFERRIQVERLLSGVVAELPEEEPVVIAGDLNDARCRLTTIFERAGFTASERPSTFPAFSPALPLDGVFARGLSIERAFAGDKKICRQASDHLPLIVDLRLHP